MQKNLKILFYGALLVLFGLFAVYSTSIWKSFDQRTTVKVVQNIETVQAFSTFLQETILDKTAKSIASAAVFTGEQSDFGSGEALLGLDSLDQIEAFSLVEMTGQEEEREFTPLVAKQEQKIKKRNNYVLFLNQIRSLIVALVVFFIVLFIPLSYFKNVNLIYVITIGAFIFQLLVFIPGIAATNGEARGWVDLPGLPNMQPAEFFKLAYVIFMSYWITKRKQIINSPEFLIQFGAINAIILLIILLIPDFGTLFILALTGTIMAWYAGLKTKHIGMLGGAAGIVAIIGIVIITLANPNNYAFVRLKTFFETDPEVRKTFELREGWQIQQGLTAIGGGGFWGQGYGKGLQKMGQLPEAYSDMIFAAFSEEIGFVGNMLLFALYLSLAFVVFKQLKEVKDPQMRTFAVGVLSLIMVQVFVHVGVNVEILPNTGLTLPFVSHGGTALMINLIELALLYKILKGE